MALSALEYLGLYCPALAAEAAVSTWLQAAAARMSGVAWGSRALEAQARIAAHLYTLANVQDPTGGGMVAAERVGDWSKNYASVADGSDAWWKLTTHGQAYLQLRRSLSATGPRWIGV